MKGVISVMVTFSTVVHKISNLPLLTGQRLHLVFFYSIHYFMRTKQKTIIPGAKPGSASSIIIRH